MELVKCCEFVYEISVSLAWLTHTGSKKSCLSKRPAKMAQQGLVCEQGSVSLTPAAKASHRPIQAGLRGDLALLAVNLQDFFFFGVHSYNPFLCLCGAVFIQEAPSFDPPNNVL